MRMAEKQITMKQEALKVKVENEEVIPASSDTIGESSAVDKPVKNQWKLSSYTIPKRKRKIEEGDEEEEDGDASTQSQPKRR